MTCSMLSVIPVGTGVLWAMVASISPSVKSWGIAPTDMPVAPSVPISVGAGAAAVMAGAIGVELQADISEARHPKPSKG